MGFEEKRFKLSREPFAKERVEGVKRAIETIQAERPEVISLALFGSLVKGNTKEESDIDAYAFIDADRLGIDKETALIDTRFDFNVIRDRKFYDVTFRYKKLRPDIESDYQKFVQAKFKTKLPGLTDKQVEDIRATPIDHDSLATMLDDIIASYQKFPPEGAESTTIHLGRFSPVSGEPALREVEGSRIEPNHVLWGLFFLDAGKGLTPYRKQLIERLEEAGPIGEQVWRDLIDSIETWEQKVVHRDQLPTPVRYPRTLAAARELYIRNTAGK